jgi:methionyl-tRNA formyltransferase
MGSSDFAVPALDALIGAGHEIITVYSQPPRPADRGQKEKPSAIHAAALSHGLDVRTPVSLKDDGEQAAFEALFESGGADAAVVAAYGLLLPKTAVEAPRLGCLNIHASLLPRWRGAAPIQRAILEGDAKTGVSIMQMDEGLDTGGVFLTGKAPITGETTAETLHDQLAALGAALILDALEGLRTGTLSPEPQPEEGVTYAPKLDRDEGRIDWRRPAGELERQVRALNPWPGVWFEHDGGRIKVLAAETAGQEKNDGAPGTLVDDALAVACGSGVLRLLRLQRAGKEPQDGAAFVRGFPMGPGTRLA